VRWVGHGCPFIHQALVRHCQLNEKIPDKLVKPLTFDMLNP
jgi:hypothetical protein